MEIKHSMGVRSDPVTDPAAKDVKMRMLVGPESSAPTFHMRQFEVAPGGHTPKHSHPWEHECYILEGQAKVFSAAKGTTTPVKAGDVIYVPPGEEHQFINDHWSRLVFLCMVPKPCDKCQG